MDTTSNLLSKSCEVLPPGAQHMSNILTELIGFEKEYIDLLNRYEKNNLPNSILIHGLSGIGKRTFLNKLVKNIINIEFKDNNLDHHLNLFKNNTHPNIKIIEKEIDSKTGKIKTNITIDQIRRLKTFLNSTSIMQNSSKIVIVDSADSVSYTHLTLPTKRIV